MKRTILIVDDEERILFVLEHALKKLANGIDIETAATAEAGLSKTKGGSFDLIISDIIMPDMDGIEFTERIRDLEPDITIVWMTAYGCHSFREDAERLSVYRCVEKPLEVETFRELVRQAIDLDGHAHSDA